MKRSSSSAPPAAERARDADQQGERHEQRRVGEPPHLEPLDPARVPEAHPHRHDRRDEAGEHAEHGDRPQDAGGLRQRRQRPVHALVGRLERFRIEEAEQHEARATGGRDNRDPAPPRRWQSAIGEHEHDRGQHEEQQRPRRLIPEHRPLRTRQRPGALLHRVLGVRRRGPEAGEQHRVRQKQPADRMPRPARHDQQSDRERGNDGGEPERVLPPRIRTRAGEDAEHHRERREAHGDSRE